MKIHIRVHSNGDDCLVIWDAPQLPRCLGFAIGRERELPSSIERKVLENRLGFKGQAMKSGETRPSYEWPFQRYDWTDHSVSTGDKVRYCVTPIFADQQDNAVPDVSQSSGWTPWTTLSPVAQNTSIYFNRGLVMSQFMSRALKGNFSIASLKKFKSNLSNYEDDLRKFLGGDLLTKMISQLESARADGQHIYAALYELSDPELIEALSRLKKRAHVILANGSDKKEDGNAHAAETLTDVIDLHRRMLASRGLGHNKFVVFTDANRNPVSVWTGSTNWAQTGLCTQINNGLLIEDADLAQQYLSQWKLLKESGDTYPAELKDSNSIVKDIGGNSVFYTPTRGRVDLEYASKLIEDAKESVFFLMFKPGTEGLLNAVQRKRLADKNVYLFGVINDLEMAITSGSGTNKKTNIVSLVSDEVEKQYPFSILEPEGVKAPLATWAEEVTRRDFFGKNQQFPTVGHAIIHAKLFVVDPFGANPIVVTGSHNFSKSASEKNDENLLVIRNNPELAQKYCIAINAIYDHYRWRSVLARGTFKNPGLETSDGWQLRKRKPNDLSKIRFWMK